MTAITPRAYFKAFTNSLFCRCSLFICLLFPVSGFAQIPATNFRHISYEQGLSNTTILCIMQDSRGFMWFGTRDGLNRYDGTTVTVYKNNPYQSSSLRDNFVRCIYEGSAHKLWIGTSYGLASFDPQTDRFTRYWHSFNGKNIADDIVTGICEDGQNNLWIGTLDSGVYKFDKQTHFFTHYGRTKKRSSISSDSVNYVFKDSQQRIWIGTEDGLNLLDPKTGTFKAYKQPEEAVNNINCLTEDASGNLWMGTDNRGLVMFNTQTKTFKNFRHNDADAGSLSTDEVISVLADKKGNIWAGTYGGGLNLLNPANNSFYKYTPLPENPASLSNLTVSALFDDKQGNFWIGTHRGGVNLYSAGVDKFRLFRAGITENSLSYDDVKAFFQDSEGNIWIGTDGGGLNLYDKKTGTFKRYKNDPLNPKSLSSNSVMAIAQDSKGNLWVGTWGGGLNLIDKKTGTFTHFKNNTADKTSISSDFLQRLYLDSKGNFWVATYYGGLNRLNADTHQFTRITTDSTATSSFAGNNVVSIDEDHDGNVWFGTDDGGLNAYSLNTKHFTHYLDHEDKKIDSRVIFTDSKGQLWLGQQGLYLFNRQQGSFKLFTDKAGLGSSFIKGITEGGDHNLWVSTSNGLVKLNPNTGECNLFNTMDGLQGMEFEANSYMKANDGEIFFGGINGFNSFYPGDIKTNKFIPPVYITGFLMYNKIIKPDTALSPLNVDISYTKQIKLHHYQSSVSFTFAALNYTNSANNQYLYKLEGFDTVWTYAGAEHRAVYTNLDPGTYTFKVKASNNDGLWNNEGSSVTIIIASPFWSAWWFRIFLVVVAIFLLYSYKEYVIRETYR